METARKIISTTLLFHGLPEEQVSAISRIAVQKTYQKGEIIFSEGDDGNGFYIVVKGRVKIFKVSNDGKEYILHLFDGGEPIGEVPVFSGEKFPATALALTKSVLLFFPRAAFVDLLTKNTSLAMNMLAVLAMRLRQFTVQIENLSLKEVPARLAAYLLYLSGEQANTECVTLSISKGQLASLLGTIPETLSRIMAKMNRENLIEVQGREIYLLDMNGITELAEQGKF